MVIYTVSTEQLNAIKQSAEAAQTTANSAQTIAQKAAEDSWKLQNYTPYLSGDLNTLVTPGTYCCPDIASSSNVANKPVEDAFVVQVVASLDYEGAAAAPTYIRQVYTDYVGNYYRRHTSDGGATWSSWANYTNTAFATAEQGTLATSAMPKAGGTFTGNAMAATTTDETTAMIRNIVIVEANTDFTTLSIPAGTIIMVRK